MSAAIAQVDAKAALRSPKPEAPEPPAAAVHVSKCAGEEADSTEIVNSDESNEDVSASQSNPNCAANEDLEAGTPPPPTGDAAATLKGSEAREVVGGKRAAIWRWRFCFAFSILLTSIVVALGVFLYPRDPSWHLTHLDIDVTKFSMAMMNQGNLSEPLGLTADVQFSNPNYIGTTTEPGVFEVIYDGGIMAWGTTDVCSVGPQSSSDMQVDVTVKFTEAMAAAIVNEVIANNMELKVQAKVLVVAKVAFLRIKTHVHCDITAATTRLFAKPEDVLKDVHCKYSYSL
jgi:hypothetical protein